MSNKVDMSIETALSWVDRAIAQDQKDIAISILKDLLSQAIEMVEHYKQLLHNAQNE